MSRRALFALPMLLALTGADDPPAWTEPTPPFRIAGPIYYVGTKGLAAYLIQTRAGAILIDGTMDENVPAIERSIMRLGVPLRSVKVLLNSHAHFDHAGGLARVRRDTGASLQIMDADAEAIRTGVPPSVTSYGVIRFPPARVDRVLHDGDRVALGGVTLTAVKTPGHTAGCTTWTMRLPASLKPLDVVFPCSLTVAGNRLVGNIGYPGIVADFRRTFARMAAMRADIVLPAHPEIADVLGRHERGAFVDPNLLPKLVVDARKAFDVEYERQRATAAKSAASPS